MYDDACHLLKYVCNKIRCNETETAQRMAKMCIVCDRFHFKNHVDPWCHKNCNPYTCSQLDSVSEE